MKKLSLLIMCLSLSACASINQTKTIQPINLEKLTIEELVNACNATNLNFQDVK